MNIANSIKLIIFLLAGGFSLAHASFKISKVSMECGSTDICRDYQKKTRVFTRSDMNKKALLASIKQFMLKGDITNLSYKLISSENGKLLKLRFEIVPILEEIVFIGANDVNIDKVKNLLSLREGDYFSPGKVQADLATVRAFVGDRGYLQPLIKYKIVGGQSEIKLQYDIKLGPATIVEDISVQNKNDSIKKLIKNKLLGYIGDPYNKIDFKLRLSEIEEDMLKNGYLFSSITLKDLSYRSNSFLVVPELEVKLGPKYIFSFYGNKIFNRQELLKEIRNEVGKTISGINVLALETALLKMYKKKGFYNVKIKTSRRENATKNQYAYSSYYFKIEENQKTIVDKILFTGSGQISSSQLLKNLDKEASGLVRDSYYDEKFFKDFKKSLERYYWQNGFIFINVSGPIIVFSDNKKNVSIEYKISEGLQTRVATIKLSGIDESNASAIKKILYNQEGRPFNSHQLPEDYVLIENYLKSIGHLNVVIKNKNDQNAVVSYSNGYHLVDLFFDIEQGKVFRFNEVIVIGNIKTKNRVIERELRLQKGEVLSAQKLQGIKKRLESIGLFAKVSISTLEDILGNGMVNLLISVKEKDRTHLAISPGFRTDIGARFEFEISRENLGGVNRSVGFKTVLNQRFNLDTLDSARRERNKRFIEYTGTLNFTEPYLFRSLYTFNTSLNATKRRFRSFDAEILRVNTIFSREFTDYFFGSLKYQFESITQNNATDPEKDNGHFSIGGVTSAITFDLRDSRIKPRSGAYFNLSLELANPLLLSQNDSDIEINFIKFISRNRFYIPMSFGLIAMSYSMGYQQDISRTDVGRIPSIKVFRLTGIDLVRGFADDEINRLDSREDIQDALIDNSAFFQSLKIEPRIEVDDNVLVGFFFDAGKVYKDSFRPWRLRTSAGISLKYQLPVGTIDLDYGFKLGRKREPGDNPAAGDRRSLESAGRLHLSIGFF